MPNISVSNLIRIGIITTGILFVFATSIERAIATVEDPGFVPPPPPSPPPPSPPPPDEDNEDEEDEEDEEEPEEVDSEDQSLLGRSEEQVVVPPNNEVSIPLIPDVPTFFRSTTDGFELQVPAGWVIEDVDNTNITALTNEEHDGYTFLARICPQNNALPLIDGTYQCKEESTTMTRIMRFSDLYDRPEFLSLENRDINTSDLLSYYIQFWQRIAGINTVEIWNNTDTTVNIISTHTNQTVSTVPAKLVEYTYMYGGDGNTAAQYREFSLLILNGSTGYSLLYEGTASSLPSGRPPSQVQQIFDSFGLLTGAARSSGPLKG